MGKVYLVGAGPGDPGLITVRGAELLRRADAVLYDSLVPAELIEQLGEGCEKIHIGKRAGRHTASQDQINSLLIQKARQYETVVRLKGGDPLVFGRAEEEISALRSAGIPYEIIPGVSSATAVPAHAGIPVTSRGTARGFHVITGHSCAGQEEFERCAGLEGTLVFLMGLGKAGEIADGLIRGGMSPEMPAAIISHGFMADEKCNRCSLCELRTEADSLEGPAVIVVGRNALKDIRCGTIVENGDIAVICSDSFERRFREALGDLSGRTTRVMRMRPEVIPAGREELKKTLRRIGEFRTVAFFSQNAARMFFELAEEEKIGRASFDSVRFAVTGPGTAAALSECGFSAEIMPGEQTSEALGRMIAESCAGDPGRVLLIRSQDGRGEIYDELNAGNIPYETIILYRTEGTLLVPAEAIGGFRNFVFTSASGVRSLHRALEENGVGLPEDRKIICIGEATAEEVRKLGFGACAAAYPHTAGGLASAVRKEALL